MLAARCGKCLCMGLTLHVTTAYATRHDLDYVLGNACALLMGEYVMAFVQVALRALN